MEHHLITLGISDSHNSSACLMMGGVIKGLIQEERLTKRKNQMAFPLLSIGELVDTHLGGDASRIDYVAFGSKILDPYYVCLDLYNFADPRDAISDMYEIWHPHFYGSKSHDGSVWRDRYINGRNVDGKHNYDFSFITKDISHASAIKHFSSVERPAAVKRHLSKTCEIGFIDHHKSHAYYAAYGSALSAHQLKNTVVLTADSWGDYKNWSVSTVRDDGTVQEVASGDNFTLARVYKFCTLILGMKPNEHEYKVMGLAGYSSSVKHVEQVQNIFFEILDFKDGNFVSRKPLVDSYFDLKQRLEGLRFDNIAAGLQIWSSKLTLKWAEYWRRYTKKGGIAFSGGLSMNIKSNGHILAHSGAEWLAVPASGGDESLSAGACLAVSLESKKPTKPIGIPYLGTAPDEEKDPWYSRLNETGMKRHDFDTMPNFTNEKIAKLLLNDIVIARCVGPAEFGARALGNRSILANPSNFSNIKVINDKIKNRDFWMPFTPSILEEYADTLIDNPKSVASHYMTVGYESTDLGKEKLQACLHMGDYSARPQFVSKFYNANFWSLIDQFFKLSGVPAVLNTSLNLHGDPMNWSLADAGRTLALSSLDFLIMPEDTLLFKKDAFSILEKVMPSDIP